MLKRCFILVIWACVGTQAAAVAYSPLAVLSSESNIASYQDQHLGNYTEDWLLFKHTLDAANVRYDLLSDSDIVAGYGKLASYKVLLIPVLLDLPSGAISALKEYVKGGGKLLITDGGGNASETAQSIMALAGVTATKHTTMQESKQLVWQKEPLPLVADFAVGTLIAEPSIAPEATTLAKWQSTSGAPAGIAIAKLQGSLYLSWAPGLQGEITANASLLSASMEELVPGITQQAAVQISFAEYQTITQELEYLAKRTDEVIRTAKQADLAVSFKVIHQDYESAQAHVKSFHEAYKNRQFLEADEKLSQARQDFALAFAQAMPVRPVEARAVWLDRGTIVATAGPVGLTKLFDRLKKAGINTVYFETNNAGFSMFPSQIEMPNPQVASWNPLAVAVEQAHKRGMELHSWIWVFAVGNIRHNPIIGRLADYPGPVLSSQDFSWALSSGTGSLLPPNQPEFWLDPANSEARQYLKNFTLEIVQKYPVDGIQLDYIRYPFNNKGSEMGFDWVGRLGFERETGLSLDKLDDETRQVWLAWKAAQITEFVRDVSTTIKRIRPDLRISAAVYSFPRRMRLNAIQQEWETWVSNGWVDTLNPMTYVTSAEDLSIKAGYVRESTQDKALVFPGLSIRQLDTAGLIEQLDAARALGTLGTTLFAVAQLDDAKLSLLKLGPYRKQALLTPQSYPVRASRLLIDDFAALVNRYLQDPRKHILSDQSSTNEVLAQIMTIQKDLHQLSEDAAPSQVENIGKQVSCLHELVKNWLRLEAFVQRGFRAQYISNYLNQVEAILSYAAHRARSLSRIADEGDGG